MRVHDKRESGRWVLYGLYRNDSDKDFRWRVSVHHATGGIAGPTGMWFDHCKQFKTRPTNKDIYDALSWEVLWQFKGDENCVSCGVCEKNWEAVTGEKPTRFFPRPRSKVQSPRDGKRDGKAKGQDGAKGRRVDPDRDAVVLKSVLVDLLSYANSRLELKSAMGKQVFFSPKALTYPIEAPEVLRGSGGQQVEKLPKDQLRRAKEAAQDLAQRAEKVQVFKSFVPRDKRITLYSKEQAKRHERLPQVFHAWSPGYSQDGSLAVVRLSFTWAGGRHHAEAIYLLAIRNDEWSVVLRDFIFYV